MGLAVALLVAVVRHLFDEASLRLADRVEHGRVAAAADVGLEHVVHGRRVVAIVALALRGVRSEALLQQLLLLRRGEETVLLDAQLRESRNRVLHTAIGRTPSESESLQGVGAVEVLENNRVLLGQRMHNGRGDTEGLDPVVEPRARVLADKGVVAHEQLERIDAVDRMDCDAGKRLEQFDVGVREDGKISLDRIIGLHVSKHNALRSHVVDNRVEKDRQEQLPSVALGLEVHGVRVVQRDKEIGKIVVERARGRPDAAAPGCKGRLEIRIDVVRRARARGIVAVGIGLCESRHGVEGGIADIGGECNRCIAWAGRFKRGHS
eukprot:comp22048_c0_seq2/m.50905 comp22048_c0_seq2/g.50905  ORF comp22048_c0_seq2/g.50905 comp22048_c0_seq2/m.50905 type:complete len:322 (-) comp22048_c0_seq2:69-1034(-)